MIRKGLVWNWGELPCDNLFGDRRDERGRKSPVAWRRGQQSANDTLHLATVWIGKAFETILPSSFLYVPAFSMQGLQTEAPQSNG